MLWSVLHHDAVHVDANGNPIRVSGQFAANEIGKMCDPNSSVKITPGTNASKSPSFVVTAPADPLHDFQSNSFLPLEPNYEILRKLVPCEPSDPAATHSHWEFKKGESGVQWQCTAALKVVPVGADEAAVVKLLAFNNSLDVPGVRRGWSVLGDVISPYICEGVVDPACAVHPRWLHGDPDSKLRWDHKDPAEPAHPFVPTINNVKVPPAAAPKDKEAEVAPPSCFKDVAATMNIDPKSLDHNSLLRPPTGAVNFSSPIIASDINGFQRSVNMHSKPCKSTCFKKGRSLGCRFFYPKPFEQYSSTLAAVFNKFKRGQQPKLVSYRNHSLVNGTCLTTMLTWRANSDKQFIVSGSHVGTAIYIARSVQLWPRPLLPLCIFPIPCPPPPPSAATSASPNRPRRVR